MRTLLSLIAIPIAFLVGCSDNSNPGNMAGIAGATSAVGGSPSAGGKGGADHSTAGGGAPGAGTGASSGAPTTAGSSAGGHGGTAGAPNDAGATGMAGAGGNAAGAGNASGAGAGGIASGGMSGAGGAPGGGMPVGGTSAGGDGNSTACTRDLLKSTTTAYFTALAAHDKSSLPLADGVKFTENGAVLMLGMDGLWKTAGPLKYAHTALDTKTCTAVSQAVVPDGSTDIPLGLRLKLVNQKITEVEHIAVRKGDYSVASDTQALAASNDTVKWEEAVPADQQNSYEELSSWMDKYYRKFPNGVCNTTSDCKRLENGGGSFSCSGGASCSTSSGGADVMTPRLIVADVDAGLGVGFTMFQGTDTDMHMFKMKAGKVYAVSAILAAAGKSGWE